MTTVNDSGGGDLGFEILGPLRAVRDGNPIALGGARQRAVLARLLAEPDRVVSLTELAEAVWRDNVPPGYVATLQTYIYHLRVALEPKRLHGAAAHVLVTERGGYRLAVGDGVVDAVRFEGRASEGRRLLDGHEYAEADARLTEALALWHGPVLADLADFDFVSPLSARLDQLRLDAMEARLEAQLGLGRHADVAVEVGDLVRQHPLREHLYALRMVALFRGGRQAEALDSYRQLRRLLIDELGIEPSPVVRDLHSKILAQDPGLRRTPPLDERPATHPSATPPKTPAAPAPKPPKLRKGRVLAAVTVIALAVAVAAAVAIQRSWHTPPQVTGDSLAALGRDGTIRSVTPIGHAPESLVVSENQVWVANTGDSTISRLDIRTGSPVQTLSLAPTGESPVALAVLGDAVWVANALTANVSEVSVLTGQVVDTVPVGHQPSAIAAGFGRVWVANAGDATVSVINPSQHPHLTTSLDVGTEPDGIAIGADAVWVSNRADDTVSRIDPNTLTASSPIRVGAGPVGIAATVGAVWVADSLDLTVTRIATDTLTTTTTKVGDTPLAIAAFAGAVWIGTTGDDRITRLDPESGQVSDTHLIGAPPQALIATKSTLWVVTGPAPATVAHRGGTLTFADVPDDLGTIDPATGYGNLQFLWDAVYDTLVTTDHTDGAAAFQLVPDLAVSLPAPTAGGTSYTFTLRPGIRYSDGRPLRASDFRRAFERELPLAAQNGIPNYYADIVGGGACAAHPNDPCTLNHGIITDDHARTVGFTLTHPDPDFLAKLSALDLTAPVPPGTARYDIGTQPIPGTGPYRITQFRSGKLLVLSRNPYFHAWSTAAQPNGYPNVIRDVAVPSRVAAVAAVVRGRADVTNIGEADIKNLSAAYPGRVWSGPATGTGLVVLNAQIPPFSNRLARQAAAYALNDDAYFSAILGGMPSCTLLPQGWPGQRGNCQGRPNLALAANLVHKSGTSGEPVHVYVANAAPYSTVLRHATTVLNSIGYRATLTREPANDYQVGRYDRRTRPVNVEGFQWWPDFPALSQFYEPLLSCADGLLREVAGCNANLDHLATQALLTQTNDPARAQRLWERVYTAVDVDARVIASCSLPPGAIFASSTVENPHFGAEGTRIDQFWVR